MADRVDAKRESRESVLLTCQVDDDNDDKKKKEIPSDKVKKKLS